MDTRYTWMNSFYLDFIISDSIRRYHDKKGNETVGDEVISVYMPLLMKGGVRKQKLSNYRLQACRKIFKAFRNSVLRHTLQHPRKVKANIVIRQLRQQRQRKKLFATISLLNVE